MDQEQKGKGKGCSRKPTESLGDQESLQNQNVIALPNRGTMFEHGLEGQRVRTLIIDRNPWFVAADVCRAVSLRANNGSYAHHLQKLEDDEKRLVARDAILLTTPTSTLKVEVPDEQEDPLTAEISPHTWLVSEGGLYAIMMRCRQATVRGTFAYRFRRWVTNEVLPAIRRTGVYAGLRSTEGDDPPIVIPAPEEATRFVVLAAPGKAPHIRRTAHTEMLVEFTALDLEGLSIALKTIEVWWNKSQVMKSVRAEHDSGFAVHQLERAITNGAQIADQYLGRQHQS